MQNYQNKAFSNGMNAKLNLVQLPHAMLSGYVEYDDIF